MRILKFNITSEGKHLGTTPIMEQAINAVKGYAIRNGADVSVTALLDNGKTREVIYKPNGDSVKVWKVVANQMPLMDYAASKHAAAHATTGSDLIAPADIGAAPKSHTHVAATMPPSAHKHTKSDITDFRPPCLPVMCIRGLKPLANPAILHRR